MRMDYVRLTSSYLIFGSNGIVASRIMLSSLEIVYLRTFIGSLFLIAAFLLAGGKFTVFRKGRDLCFLLLSGIAMGTSWMFLYEAYRQIGVGLATLAYYVGPAIVMVAAPLVFKEKLIPARLRGFAVVLLGMALVNSDAFAQGTISWGLACGLMSAIMLAVMVILNRLAASITGFENAVLQLTISFLTVAVFTVARQGFLVSIPSGSLLPMILLGLVNTGYGCYLYFSTMQRLPAQTVVITGYLEPLSALIFSALLLGERMTPVQIVGAAMILGGALYGERAGMKAAETEA
ncbi:MAG: EamA family transporter [Synergistaceae bacterium]|nr:DMT family transporter [Synergistota bacterium]NLM71280.1 EamA family transporter [Synergistaceae bacterium]